MELDKLNGSSIEEEIWWLKLSFAELSAELEIMSDWWWTDNDDLGYDSNICKEDIMCRLAVKDLLSELEVISDFERPFKLESEVQLSVSFDFDDNFIDE